MYTGVPANCIDPLPISAYEKFYSDKEILTYFEPCQTKVTYFNLHIFIKQHILTLDVSMNYAQGMHVTVDLR